MKTGSCGTVRFTTRLDAVVRVSILCLHCSNDCRCLMCFSNHVRCSSLCKGTALAPELNRACGDDGSPGTDHSDRAMKSSLRIVTSLRASEGQRTALVGIGKHGSITPILTKSRIICSYFFSREIDTTKTLRRPSKVLWRIVVRWAAAGALSVMSGHTVDPTRSEQVPR